MILNSKWFLSLKIYIIFSFLPLFPSKPEECRGLNERARLVINHLVTLLADGYVALSPATDKAMKDAAIVRIIRHIEELLVSAVSETTRLKEHDNIVRTMALLLKDDTFFQSLQNAIAEKIRNEIVVLE